MTILYVSMLIIGIAVSTCYLQQWNSMPWLLAYILAVNGVTFIAYLWDKLMAPLNDACLFGWLHLRIRNWVLFWLLGALGGTIGAAAGIAVAPHKVGPKYVVYRDGLATLLLIQAAFGLWLLTAGQAALAPLNASIAQVTTGIMEFTLWIAQEFRAFLAGIPR